MSPRAAAAVCAATLLVGCGGGPLGLFPGDGVDHRRMYSVADDEDATAAEVVAAGRAVDAARSGDHVLVTYTVHQDSTEGRSAAAWRLYDADGATVADGHAGVTDEGAAHAAVTALPDGFLLAEQDGPTWHVTTDGARSRVTRAPEPLAPRSGDVPIGEGLRLFRPATRTLFAAAPRPPRQTQGWAMSPGGTVWTQDTATEPDGPVRFHRSVDGGPWVPVASHDPGADGSLDGHALTAVGDHVVVPVVAAGSAPDRVGLTGLLVRSGSDPDDRPWELLPATVAEGGWFDTRVQAVGDSTALVGTWGSEHHLVDLADRTWRRLAPPTDEDGWNHVAEGERLYAFDHDHADAWFSDDRGESWDRLPH